MAAFYLPESVDGRVREGFIRLDRIQAVHKNLLEHMSRVLGDEVRDLLQSWIRVYLGEEVDAVDGVLFYYREQAIADLIFPPKLPPTPTSTPTRYSCGAPSAAQ